MLALSERPVDLTDYTMLSVGGLEVNFRDRVGKLRDKDVDLSLMADNIDVLRAVANGQEIRWLMLTSPTAILPYDRVWQAVAILVEVENISMGMKAVRDHGIDTTGFEGSVDYVLIHLLESRRMIVMVMFDTDSDAVLAKMRHPLG